MKNKCREIILFALLFLSIFLGVKGYTSVFSGTREYYVDYLSSNSSNFKSSLKVMDNTSSKPMLMANAVSKEDVIDSIASTVKGIKALYSSSRFEPLIAENEYPEKTTIAVKVLTPKEKISTGLAERLWYYVFVDDSSDKLNSKKSEIKSFSFIDAHGVEVLSSTGMMQFMLSINQGINNSIAEKYGIDYNASTLSDYIGKSIQIRLNLKNDDFIDYTIYFIKEKNTVNWVSDTENGQNTFSYGEKITMPENIQNHTVEGKVLDCWKKEYSDSSIIQTTEDNCIVDLSEEVMGLSDVTYTAQWVQTEEVTFHYSDEWKNQPETTEVVAQVDGKKWKTPESDPTTREDDTHKFAGWYKSNSDFSDNNRIDLNKEYTSGIKDVYAHWNITGYSVNFHYDGKTDYYLKETLNEEDAPKPSNRKGYTFKGWSTEETGGDLYKFGQKLTANIDLYAQWEAENYTIEYELNGGENSSRNPSSYTIENDIYITNPTRVGYKFTGWTTTEKGIDKKFSYHIVKGSTGALKLYAQWEALTYTIEFAPGSVDKETVTGGSAPQRNIPFDYFIENDKLKTLTKNSFYCRGYEFVGWKLEGKEELLTDGSEIKENLSSDPEKYPRVTLTAQWKKKNYSIALDLNPSYSQETKYYPGLSKEDIAKDRYTTTPGSSYRYAFTYTFRNSVGDLPTPIRNGYTFAGWYYEKDGKEVEISSNDNLVEKLDETIGYDWKYGITLKAHWTRREDIPVKVEYHIQNVDGYSYYTKDKTFNCGNVEQAKYLGDKYKEYYTAHNISGDNYKDVSSFVLSDDVLKELGIYEGFELDTTRGILSNGHDETSILSLYFNREKYKISFEVNSKKNEHTYLYGQDVKVPDISNLTNSDSKGYRDIYWIDNEGNKIAGNELKDFKASKSLAYKLVYDEYYEASIGTTTYRTLALALEKAKPGDIVIPHPDKDGNLTTTMEETKKLVVPEGVTLLIPCVENDKGYDSTTGFNPNGGTGIPDSVGKSKNAKLYMNVKIPEGVTLEVNGLVLVNAVTGRPNAGHFDMDVTGGYGEIDLEGSIVVNDGGVLDICGYLKGSGTVTANSGGEVRDLYIVRNWRGGSFALDAYLDDIYPMNEVDMHNIETKTVINSGAKLVGTVKMYASSSYYYTRFPQIDNENGLIRLTKGSITKTYENNREKFALNGDGTFASSELEIVGMALSTGGYLFPIDGDIDFTINGNWTVNERFKFMPGVTVNVESGSITVSNKTNYQRANNQIVFYDKFDDSSNTGTAYPKRSASNLVLDGGVTITVNNPFAGQVLVNRSATKSNPAILDLTKCSATLVETQESGGAVAAKYFVNKLTFKTSIGTSNALWNNVRAGNKYKIYYDDNGNLIVEGVNETQEKKYTGSAITWDSEDEITVEYKAEDGEWTTEAPVNVGTYSVRQVVTGGEDKVVIPLGTLTIVPSPLATPNAKVDFDNQTLTGLTPGNYKVTYGDTTETLTIEEENETIPLNDNWYGKELTIVQLNDEGNTNNYDSEPQKLSIPEIPSVPSGLKGIDPSLYGLSDGHIDGLDSKLPYEYRLLPDGEWIPVNDADSIKGLAAGSYEVRVRATDASFKSESVTIEIVNPPLMPEIIGTPEVNFASKDEDISNSLLSDEEKELTYDGVEIEIKLSVENANDSVSDEEKELVVENIGDYFLGEYLDIELHKIIKEKNIDELVSEIKRPIRISIQVPNELLNHNLEFAIIRVHDGEATVLKDLDNDPKTITIETDKFSLYTLVYRQIPVDKSALKEAINKANKLKEDAYTAASWAKLESTLKDAQNVYDNKEATEEAVNDATKDLNKAIDSLEKKQGKLVKGKAATCTTPGRKSYYVYEDKWYEDKECTKEIKDHDSINIPAKGHDITYVEAKEATSTQDGNIAYWYCSNCDKYFKDKDLTEEISKEDTIIPATKEEAKKPVKVEEENEGLAWWVWLILGIVFLFFIIIIIICRRKDEEEQN